MYAITLPEFGDPDVMQWAEVDDPVAGPGEVLIDVAATAVNRADVMQRQGNYPPPPGASDILGLECSGTVAALGEGVHDWQVGDQVCALLAGGGYAERVAVPAAQLMPIPVGLDLRVAASLPEVACTVWSNLVMAAGMRTSQSLLVHGGSGGIGTHAIQVATALGVRVAVTAGTPAKLERCRELGAELTIDYHTDDFVASVADWTADAARPGVDLILDNIGAKYLARNISALAADGTLCIIGMQGGRKGELDLSLLLAKRAKLIATGLRPRPVTGPSSKAEIVRAVVDHVWPMIDDSRVRPIVDTELPLPEAAQAHRLLDSGEVFGKVLLTLP